MESILIKYTTDQAALAAQVKAIVFDIDGVMTDGGIIYDNQGNELKKFNAKDGMIVKPLRSFGIIVGALTGRDSPVVRARCEELGLDFHYHGVKDKLGQCGAALSSFGLTVGDAAYLGDDLIDLALIRYSGMGVAPADAPLYVQQEADLVTGAAGGRGVLREVGDFVLSAQGRMEKVLETYLGQG